jgi:phosphoglycerol transferase
MTKTLIDTKFISHLDWNVISNGYKWFVKEIIVLIIVFFTIYYFICKITKKLNNIINTNLNLLFIIILIIPMFINSGAFHNFYNIYKTTIEVEGRIEDALTSLGLPATDSIVATKGKNIIILTLESYESAYLDSSLSHISPNLRDLKNKWNTYHLNHCITGGYTFGALHAYITGFPVTGLGSSHLGNMWGTGLKNNSQLPNLINILNQAGYKTRFFKGYENFAGTSDLMNSCGNIEIYDIANIGQKYNSFGFTQDLDLF